LSNVSHFLKFL